MEFQIIEQATYAARGKGALESWWGETWAGLTARAVEQAGRVPIDVEVGFHLCYGDAGEKHFVGLVHREDGAEGARRRVEAAKRHVERFGVATECGCGRAPADATEGLLRTHAEVAAAW
ncbi:hypothetical protein ACLQ2Q_08375 [Microbacterium sp. DT81.1]|uniref:hypothetical protein n=1 Tax=Microbacterium sp. DT81.1 TaxID=3393413 RepID=UPI003CE8B23E